MLGRSVAPSWAALLALVPLLIAGCGSDSGASETASLASPAVFAERMDAPGVVTINVHTPDEGSIPGTDVDVPFDRIATSTEIPDDVDTPLAVYCRSGDMSADAVEDLEAMGYTDIMELDGGFDAWQSSGRDLELAR